MQALKKQAEINAVRGELSRLEARKSNLQDQIKKEGYVESGGQAAVEGTFGIRKVAEASASITGFTGRKITGGSAIENRADRLDGAKSASEAKELGRDTAGFSLKFGGLNRWFPVGVNLPWTSTGRVTMTDRN